MSKYTAKEVDTFVENASRYLGLAVSEMLTEYATLLRERESVKAAVTDDVVHEDIEAYVISDKAAGVPRFDAFKGDLEAVAPMLASARVPDELSLGQRAVAAELLRCCESWEPGVRVMGNVKAGDAADLLRNVLAAAPKPETEE